MARPSDREFSLHRRIKELTEQNGRLEDEIVKLKRIIAKSTTEETPAEGKRDKKKTKVIDHPCPDCGAATKTITLPNALLDVCTKVCGWKKIR